MECANKAFTRRCDYKRIDVIPTIVTSGSVQGLNPRSDKYCRKSARLSEQILQSKISRDEAMITL